MNHYLAQKTISQSAWREPHILMDWLDIFYSRICYASNRKEKRLTLNYTIVKALDSSLASTIELLTLEIVA